LLGVLLLVGASLGWWLLVPKDVTSSAGVDVVRGAPTSSALEVEYTAGYRGCADPGGVTAKETSDEVRLTAHTIMRQVRPFSTRLCPAIGLWAHSTVPLSQPLGDRRVIDTTRAARGLDEVVLVLPPCPRAVGVRPKPGQGLSCPAN
jgi:hypothetical protein